MQRCIMPLTLERSNHRLTAHNRMFRVGCAAMLLAFFLVAAGHAEDSLQGGWWRAQVTGGVGLDITTINRKNDLLSTVLVEYELPVTPRLSVGLGIIPVLWYEPRKDENDTVWGAGGGIAGRAYLEEHVYRGWYAALHGYGIAHEGRFSANTSNFNYLVGGGFGYHFHNGWQIIVMFEHISNGSLGSRNQSLNTLSPSFGIIFGNERD